MSEAPDLRELKKRTLRLMNYEDGLWDLLLGFVFTLLAIYPVTRARLGPPLNVTLFVGVLLLGVAAYRVAQLRFSTPRLGYVESRRSPALKLLLVITIALVALTFGLVILTVASPDPLPNLTPSRGPFQLHSYLVEIVVLLVMVSLFGGMAFVFGVPRLFLYGWLLGAGNLASVIMNRTPPRASASLGLAAGHPAHRAGTAGALHPQVSHPERGGLA
jgi:hypothetical protein